MLELPGWISKLPPNVQYVIGVAVLAHVLGLIVAVAWALKPVVGAGKRAPFSGELKVNKDK